MCYCIVFRHKKQRHVIIINNIKANWLLLYRLVLNHMLVVGGVYPGTSNCSYGITKAHH
jgi:hypothetical protein